MNINKYENYKFESSSGKTPEFMQFARDVKKYMKKLPAGITLEDYNTGHFYIFGYMKNDKNQHIYFNIGDVRDNKPTKLMYRTATGIKDYTGGRNQYSNIETFTTNIKTIFEQEYKS